MRVIVWGINYAPEVTGIAPYNVALCEFLRGRSAVVEMVTTFPYYPAWRKQDGDRRRLFRTDNTNGVPVRRCWHFVPRKVSAWKRILHEATFVLTSTIRILALKRADIYIVVSPPLLLGAAAWFAGKIKRAPFIFYVKDLQPDAAVGLGMLKTGWFTRALYWLEAFAYKHAARVAGISPEMLDAFRRKGVPEEKLILFPDGVVLPKSGEVPARRRFREQYGFAPEEFLAIYSGNLGVKQGLGVLLDAAPLLDRNIRIVLCGDGAEREALAKRLQDRHLRNITMLPLQSHDDYRAMLVDADVSLITQQSRSGNAFFPCKLLMTLAYSSPVVSVADAESALVRAIGEGGFGQNVLPGNPNELAATLSALARDRQHLRSWGEAGRKYVERFEQSQLLKRFGAELDALAG
ncbi:MAG: WcaI family glycosyltransferase [Chthoniobacterales bacterium]